MRLGVAVETAMPPLCKVEVGTPDGVQAGVLAVRKAGNGLSRLVDDNGITTISSATGGLQRDCQAGTRPSAVVPCVDPRVGSDVGTGACVHGLEIISQRGGRRGSSRGSGRGRTTLPIPRLTSHSTVRRSATAPPALVAAEPENFVANIIIFSSARAVGRVPR